MPTTTCPFCNATLPQAASVPAGLQLVCPRCGEAVPVRDPAAVPARTAPAEAARVGEFSPRTNRRLAALVLGVMAFMAAVTLVYALQTVDFRRAIDDKNRPVTRPPAVGVLPPAELAGLGYLPDAVQLVAGVQVAAARESDPGRALLAELGVVEGRALGANLEQLDHFVLGMSLRALPPRATVVARTRQPFDGDALRRAADAGRAVERGGKTLYDAKLAGRLSGAFWYADDRTIVAALLKEDFAAVPARPRPGADHLAAPLPELLTQRLDQRSVAWAAVHVEPDAAAPAALLALLPLPDEEQAAWGKLQALTVSARVEGVHVVLTAYARGRDGPATDRIADAIERSLGAAGVVLREREKDGDWVRLEAEVNVEALRLWLGRLRGGGRGD